MMRVIKGWLLPNVGFKFRVDRPDGCGDMGVGVRRLEGGSNCEFIILMVIRLSVKLIVKLAYVEMY